jgi:hypothetical protein
MANSYERKQTMATYAVIKDGKVTNTIIAESKEVAESVVGSTCVEYTEENPVGVGYLYNGTVFTAPAVEEPTE